ncbi:hypothetical protein [Bacteroides intestinalis]|jgi:hypothetical protein|uniref:Class IIb bacteriocin, lactobin A/cerein 7B family n=1 Tax=Bacteroides intestinalis TaxID=329854 RepID=A0A139L1C2_9BACE|nr:hypothetical protein [Bacteroides intestinalis]KXT45227.1 hypothetical protein HMPREF2531_03726 [Bacteroides intestinalis]
MRNLNENAMMQEMSLQEMKEVNGGFEPITWFLLGLLATECLDRNKENDFNDGRQAARDFWGK